MDSCGTPPIPAFQDHSLQVVNGKPWEHKQAFLHPLLPVSVPVAQGYKKKEGN